MAFPLALITVALSLLPQIGRWIGGSTGQAVAEAAGAAVRSATGTDDPVAAQQMLDDNPSLRLELTQRLAEIAAEREAAADQAWLDMATAQFADVANARAQTIALAQTGSKMSWVPATLTGALVLMFGGGYFALLLGWTPMIANEWRDVVLQQQGTINTAFGLGIGYWLGTSRGAVEMRRGIQAKDNSR